MRSKWFKNTFAPNCRTKIISTEQIILLLFHRVTNYEQLPNEVKEAVDLEMDRRSSSNNGTVEDK